MTRTLDHGLATYLRSEADRVVVHDTLADIEDHTTFVRVARSSRRKNPALALMLAAAFVAVVVGLLVSRDTRPLGEPPAAQPEAIASATPTTAAPDTTPSTNAPVILVPLPAGAVLQGVTPVCATLDSIEYDCTIAAYPDVVTIDMTGYSTIIVDDTSHVSGGCRATTPDALRWTCYVGQRAIDEGIVGANHLGDWAPRGYAAG